MRTLTGANLTLFLEMHEDIVRLRQASGTDDHVPMVCDRLRSALVMAWRDYAGFDELEAGLREVLAMMESQRVKHDPAYDPSLAQ